MIVQGRFFRSVRQNGILSGALILAACLATLALALAALLAPKLKDNLAPATITADGGFAYVAPLSLKPPFGFRVGDDSFSMVFLSSLRLFEDGKLLGPAHNSLAAIRVSGSGRYAHFGKRLWFSASDSGDPRNNGRLYSITANASLHPLTIFAVALFDALALWISWPWLRDHVKIRRRLVNGMLAVALLLALLAAAGTFGRINDVAGEPKDAALVAAMLLHALGGVVILLAQFAAGAGLARLLLRERAAFADVLILGFALSLPIVALFSAIALVLPYGVFLAAAGWLLCCLPLWRWCPADRDWAGLTETMASILPFALAFGCWMGLLWHGPTDTLGGAPTGDLVYYSTSIVSFGKQLYPYLNLGYAYQPLNFYFNSLFPLLGAALSQVVALDPFLFVIAAGAASLVTSLCILLYLYVRGTGIFAGKPMPWVAPATLSLAFIVANLYPYWSVGSIPVIHAVPLTIAVVYWARKSEVWAGLVAFVVAVVGALLSKVASAAVLAPFAAAATLSQLWQASRAVRLAAFAAALAALAYSVAMLYAGALNFTITPFGPVSFRLRYDYGADVITLAPHLMRDISAVMVAALAFLLTDRMRAIAIAFGCFLFLLYSFLFTIDWVCATIIFGLVACDNLERLQRHRMLVLGALLLAFPAVMIDIAGLSSGLVWLVCIGGAVMIALRRQFSLPRASRLLVPAMAGILLCVGLAGVARGNLIVTSGWQAGVLTPKVREIWLAVRDRTPPDALIFTDQTGPEPTLLGSWNTYAFIAARQIFVSNLYMNAATRFDPARAREVLRENDAVLEGRLAPQQLRLPNRYEDYYAVVSCARAVPVAWRAMFGNNTHCLYKIEQGR